MANAFEAEPKSARKGNPVIYLALALPVLLTMIAVGRTLAARYPRSAAEPTAIEAPGLQSNPATLIKPQNVKYIG